MGPLLAQDFSELDARARAVPFPAQQHVPTLAAALTQGLPTEKEKARAIFV